MSLFIAISRISVLVFVIATTALLIPAASFPFLDPESRPGSTFNNGPNPADWLFDVTANWMRALPDSTDLRLMSIPGTHDTCADSGGPYCVTQSWTLPTQLNAGIRYLDIRARRNGARFDIHHGLCYLNMDYAEVVRDVQAFLKQHPSETIIMRLKEEWQPAEGSDPFRDIWARYYAQAPGLYVSDTKGSLPKLGNVRGKVLVLRNADFGAKKVGIDYDGPLTTIQDFYKVYLSYRDNPFGDDTVTLRQKMSKVVEFLKTALAGKSLYLNHFSGAVGMFPTDVARSTNLAGYDAIGIYARRKTTGVVIMDYPGEWLIYRVIRTNFSPTRSTNDDAPSSTVKCAARTWRLESDMTYAEFRMPESNLGREIFVRAGAYGIFRTFKFHRVWWSDLTFTCQNNGEWKVDGKMDADGRCCSYNTAQAFVTVGNRSLIRQWLWLWGPSKRLFSRFFHR